MLKRIFRFLLALISATVIFSSFSLAFAATTPSIVISKPSASVGDTVTVVFTLSDNPGLASLALDIGYNKGMLALESASSVKNGAVLSGFTGIDASSIANNPFRVSWFNMEDSSNNGTLLEVTFKVLAEATPGETPITASIPQNSAFNQNETIVAFGTLQSGSVTIKSSACTYACTYTYTRSCTDTYAGYGNNTDTLHRHLYQCLHQYRHRHLYRYLLLYLYR